ncbi:glycine--tRNA ligase subunit beta [Thermosulfurimonas dismutans]|uniref:Glycine--tRNA ligase beta subunit n=1 Tax=Thermosulfurimonas dismutans TaxID=999894 RepID=A0A179D758_9BACT|nr:glycine--tRNA ligase subunit beta [Thermosulfurimonas dismutans]OAQ21886.1 Glycyl-tRNA synthetase beta chain [Thermosulfurimonas dismutans]
MAKDLLFEIGCEELPARFIEPALQSLAEEAQKLLAESDLSFKAIKTVGTPRRLALLISGLSEKQPDRVEEVMGPPKKVAIGEDGSFTKAALGFARKQGVDPSELKIKSTAKGEYLCVEKYIQGKETRELLPGLLKELVSRIHFPKTMRWGNYDFRFARPIKWLLSLYGEEVIPLEIAGVKSGPYTYGHRFLAPEAVAVGSFEEYLERLRERYVLVDPEERRQVTAQEVRQAAESLGGEAEEDPELLFENANLVEYPFALAGTFPEEYLKLPEALIITAMREHQRYFAVRDQGGKLLPGFIAINNNRPRDPDILRRGHERVLKARLEDARFYYERDLEVPLPQRVKELSGVIYHAQLGTLYEKTERLKSICGFLAEKLFPEKKDLAVRAAELAKADLVTEVVGEFPSLQGEMGRIYALAAGEDEEVALALYEQYLPRGAEDRVAENPVGILLSLADKLDTLSAFFAVGERPTGAADPYGLRRAAYGLLKTVLHHALSLSLREILSFSLFVLERQGHLKSSKEEVLSELLAFLEKRLEGEFLAQGFPLDEVRAVLKVDFDDPYEAYLRLSALHKVRQSPDFAALSVGFKRVMNMVKKLTAKLSFDEDLLKEPAEKALREAFLEIRAETEPLLEARSYEEALRRFTSLKAPIDRFFEDVFVMVEDQALRENRLALLQEIAELFLRVADLSELNP